MLDNRHGASDQQPPEVPLAHLRYLAEPRLAAGRVLSRHEPEPGREVTATPEALHRRRKGLESHRGDRADPRYRHKASRLFVPSRANVKFLLQSDDLLAEACDLLKQKAAQLANLIRQTRVRIIECRCQPANMSRPLRRDDAELSQVTPQCVDRLRPLAHK